MTHMEKQDSDKKKILQFVTQLPTEMDTHNVDSDVIVQKLLTLNLHSLKLGHFQCCISKILI